MRRSTTVGWLVTLLACMASALSAFGQGEPAGPLRVKPGVRAEQNSAIPPGQKPLRVRVTLVTLPVSVSNSSGQPVLNLTKKDFRILDDGVPQTITHFDQGGDPLSIVLVLETSSQVAPLLTEVRKTGIIFTQMVMATTGEAAVIGYNDEVDVLRPMTTDSDLVLHAIRHLRAGLAGARLYDALDRAEDILEAQPSERRRIIVVMGEKDDSGSETKLGQVVRRAQLANISIYTIGLSSTAAAFRKNPETAQPVRVSPPGTYPVPPPPGTAQTPSVVDEQMGNNGANLFAVIAWLVEHGANAIGRNSLEIASQGTGGLHINTLKDRSIEKAMNEIGNDLHAEYLLAYHPAGNERYGYHNIEVRVTKPNLKIRTRPGYYLAPPKQ